MATLIAGVAGFIGSNLLKTLIRDCKSKQKYFGIDNFARGLSQNLPRNTMFEFEKVDLSDLKTTEKTFEKFNKKEKIEEVWHLAANSDISAGISTPLIDLNNTFLSTFNILQAMKRLDIPIIHFASSSAVYGDRGERILTEETGPLIPISNYGAMKLSSEALIGAAKEAFLNKAFIYRFPNVVGTPATHGVIFDFVEKLKLTPLTLKVLGNGTQTKPYLHVQDLISAMLFIRENSKEDLSLYNIGPLDDGISVKFIAEAVTGILSKNAKITYESRTKGWAGDIPRFKYSVKKLQNLGWKSRWGSKDAICKAIQEIVERTI